MDRREPRKPRSTTPAGRRQQHSGIVRRGALRARQPPPAQRNLLAPLLVGALALAVVIVLQGVLRTDDGTTGNPIGNGSASPAASPATPAEPTAGPTPTPSPSPTQAPTSTPEPTAAPTATPTASPSPTARPTASPSATASPGPTVRPTVPPLTGGLSIVEPADGAIFRQNAIVVRGLAPPGLRITWDIPLWFDEHTQADGRGEWSFAVRLRPGENLLTFRIGDEKATARTVTVHLRQETGEDLDDRRR